jgi:hypothetical protein
MNSIPSIDITTIGRDAANHIVINQPNVSRFHAKLIHCSLTTFLLEDLDSKHGTFFGNDPLQLTRISRKLLNNQDTVWFAGHPFLIKNLSKSQQSNTLDSTILKDHLDFSIEFSSLEKVYEDYPILKKNYKNKEKLVRTWSIITASVVGVGSVLSGGALLGVLAGSGLGMLIPTLASNLLSTEEKLEVIEREFKEKYHCPNPSCQDPFGSKAFRLLAKQKKCHKCNAIWVK